MPNRLVAVDDEFNLPPAVQTALSDKVRDDLNDLVVTAGDSADAAAASASTAANRASEATSAASNAIGAADTSEQIAEDLETLLDTWTVDTSDAAIDTLINNTESTTRETLDSLYEFNSAPLYAALANVPTFEEQAVSVPLSFGNITVTTEVPLYTALFASRIQQASMVAAASVLPSNSSYWAVRFIRYRDGVPTILARKSTEATASGGQAISAFNRWSYDLTEFSETGLLAGDVLTAKFQYVGSPDPIVRPTMTFRIAAADDVELPTPTVDVYDIFRRPNVGSLGTTTNDVTWDVSTNWGIVSNMAQNTGTALAALETNKSDCVITQRLNTVNDSSGSVGPVFRYSDDSNYWGIVGHTLFKRVGGTLDYMDSQWPHTASGDTVRVVLSGNSIRVLVDRGSTGVFDMVADESDSFNNDATMHGMRASGSGNHRVNIFEVTS